MSSILDRMYSRECAQDWILWEKGISVLSLPATADPLERDADCVHNAGNKAVHTIPAIRRPQYSAIVSRMNHAAHNAGSYSSW